MTREAAASEGGDEHALLHNMTTTLAAVGAIVCAWSVCAMGAHHTAMMAQAMFFQAIVAPSLVLCGILLTSSNIGLAAGYAFSTSSRYACRDWGKPNLSYGALVDVELYISFLSCPSTR